MNHLNVSTPISRPQHEAVALLERYFDEHAPNGEMPFVLRAPVEVPGLRVGVTFARDVIGEVSELGEKRRAYRLSWRPAGAGPFPLFKGALVIDEDEATPGRSVLTLDGRYEPPLNVAGYVFDAILGTKIAHASAVDLVDRLSAALNGGPSEVERAA
jgi:hypothetical protein